MNDLISRQEAIDAVNNAFDRETLLTGFVRSIAVRAITDMPSVQLEPLTDKEQRIFLAAMGREEEICKSVDKNRYRLEPYEDSLMYICKEIKRKVKGALWT